MQDKMLILTFLHEDTARAFCRGVETMIPAALISRNGTRVALGTLVAEDVALVRRQWALDGWLAVAKIEVETI